MKRIIAIGIMLLTACRTYAQQQTEEGASKPNLDLKYNLSKDGSKYIKGTFLNQTWLRWNESNPGTTVNGAAKDNTLDIGLRRTRMQLYGQLTDHVFFYMQ